MQENVTPYRRQIKNRPIAKVALLSAAMSVLAACSSPEQKVEKFTASGDKFLVDEEYGKANVQFQKALKIDEEHVPALMGLAKVAENRQNFKRMFGALQRIVRLDPNNTEALVQLGKLYLVGSEETLALENADKALALKPESADALALKAAVMMKLEDEALAVNLAKKALSIDPSSSEAATVLATERARVKDYEGALKYINESLANNEKQAVLHLLKLQMLKQLGRAGEVDSGYQELIGLFPEEIGYRRIYVGELLKDNRFQDARVQLEEIARLTPKQVDPVLDLVRIDYRIGGKEAAEKTFQEYVEARGDDVDLKFAYATYVRQEGNLADAEAIYNAVAANKDDPSLVRRARNEIAALRLLEGNRDAAEQIVTEILAEDERNTAALLKLAGLKIDREEYDAAIRDLRVVLDDEPQSTPARLLMASAFEKQGDVTLAESQMTQAVEDSNFAPKEANIFAKFLVRNDNQTRAENVLVESLDKNPNDIDNLKFLAAIRLLRQDWRGAEEAARLIDRVDDEDPVVNRILGAAYTGLQDYSGAISALEAENEKRPLASRPLTTLIAAYMKEGRSADAEKLLKGVVDSNPENYAARILLARVYATEKRNDEARTVLEQAIESDPNEFQGYEALYRLHISEGRVDEAKALVDSGLANAPDSDGLKVIKADNLLSAGDEEAAMALYADILTRRPNDRLVANNYASLLTKLRDDEESLQKAADVAEVLRDVDNPFFQDTLGWALVLNGDFDGGAELLRKSVEARPNLAEARFHLGYALIKNGQEDEGKEQLREAIKRANGSADWIAQAQRLLGQ